MKSKIFIAFIAFATLVSCNVQNKSEHEEEENEEHGPEGLVILNEKQRDCVEIGIRSVPTTQPHNLSKNQWRIGSATFKYCRYYCYYRR